MAFSRWLAAALSSSPSRLCRIGRTRILSESAQARLQGRCKGTELTSRCSARLRRCTFAILRWSVAWSLPISLSLEVMRRVCSSRCCLILSARCSSASARAMAARPGSPPPRGPPAGKRSGRARRARERGGESLAQLALRVTHLRHRPSVPSVACPPLHRSSPACPPPRFFRSPASEASLSENFSSFPAPGSSSRRSLPTSQPPDPPSCLNVDPFLEASRVQLQWASRLRDIKTRN